MPAKNVVKQLLPHHYYHVYNRGVAKQKIFLEQADKRYFLNLIDRHLNPNNISTMNTGLPYKKYRLNLNCYCLMGNHFHFLVHTLEDPSMLTEFMRSVATAYTMYFNLKYKRVGPLFQGAYKASQITNDSYLQHISRYIHLNPRNYSTYKYSSYQAFLGLDTKPWLKPQDILDIFEGSDYKSFVESYEDRQDMLSRIKHELANY